MRVHIGWIYNGVAVRRVGLVIDIDIVIRHKTAFST